jgi:hypothetical protein
MCVVLMDGRTEEQTGRYWLRKECREKYSFLASELARSAEYSYARRRAVRLRERCQTVCIQAAGWHKCAHCEVVARDLVISKRKVSGEGGIIKECPAPCPHRLLAEPARLTPSHRCTMTLESNTLLEPALFRGAGGWICP